MITIKNLKRAGFTATEWMGMDYNLSSYRTWSISIRPGLIIEMDEFNELDGPSRFVSVSLISEEKDTQLNVDSVTKLIQLKELLS